MGDGAKLMGNLMLQAIKEQDIVWAEVLNELLSATDIISDCDDGVGVAKVELMNLCNTAFITGKEMQSVICQRNV